MSSPSFSWAFIVDSVTFTKDVVDGKTSLGGSESSCVMLARALADRGHDVHLFTTKITEDAIGRDDRGVTWHPWSDFLPMNRFVEWDCVVALRTLQPFAHHVAARYRILWNQDLMLPNTMQNSVMSVLWGIDRMAYVSAYHRKQWEGIQPELAPIGWTTTNCFDPALVPTDVTKDPYRIIHVSRPERGLAPLLAMWPALRAKEPRATLRICRYNSMYDAGGWGEVCKSFDEQVAAVNEAVGGITYLGELNKADLYREIAEAAVMWYPGVADFAETSCIAAMEAQACGTPFVGSFKGALPETCALGGYLFRGDALKDADYHDASISAVLDLLEDCRRNAFGYRNARQVMHSHAQRYTAAKLAESWETMLDEAFSARYRNCKPGILAQLMREDDHVAARHLVDFAIGDALDGTDIGGVRRGKLQRDLELCEHVIAGRDQTADDYAERAMDTLAEAKGSGRYRAVIPMFEGCTRVLDVACGNGSFAIALCWAYPDVHVVGVDYAQANIDAATKAAAEAGVGDRCDFQRATVYDYETQDITPYFKKWSDGWADHEDPKSQQFFDGAFVGEFLEHVANAKALIDAVERPMKPGAQIVYTTPCGTCTDILPRHIPLRRGHVHRFHRDDIQAIFGHKRPLKADYLSWGPDFGVTPRGLAIGGWIISYRMDPANKTGQRDIPERIRRTRPMPRLTVGVIAKDAELDLPSCLNSIWAIADEIIVGDCGSTDATSQIAKSFGARVLHLPTVEDHKEGFAGARNNVLKAATGDWFLWIDTDERLMHAEQLRKYLDSAVFNGFAVKQKHLYLDMQVAFDEPVRVFRRQPSIQFYGCVHEQPQLDDCNGDIKPVLLPFDVEIAHLGYLNEDVRRKKMMFRNLPLLARDQAVFPERVLGKVLIMRDYVNLADAEREENRGAMTERAQRAYLEAVRLFVVHFDDPTHKMHKLARPFYESALRSLGVGWEFEVALAGKEHGMGGAHAGPQRAWVRDRAELDRMMAYLTSKCGDGMETKAIDTEPIAAPGAEVHGNVFKNNTITPLWSLQIGTEPVIHSNVVHNNIAAPLAAAADEPATFGTAVWRQAFEKAMSGARA